MTYGTHMANDRTFQMRVSDEFLRIVDEWRHKQPKTPTGDSMSRAEAIRQMVEMTAEQKGKKR